VAFTIDLDVKICRAQSGQFDEAVSPRDIPHLTLIITHVFKGLLVDPDMPAAIV
jgi:hypothetical protein